MYCYDCMKELKDGSTFCLHCGKEVKTDEYPHHLKPGTILHNQYLVGNSIGEGGFGITYVGLDLKLDIKIAIKEFFPSGYANRNNTFSNKVTLNYQKEGEYFKNGRESFLREAKSIAKFYNQRSIVGVRDFFEENDTAYIIMEYLDGMNLSDKIRNDGKFGAEEIFELFMPMIKSLDKMHQEDIIHRDITPENVRVLTDGTLKLMDFGSARYYSGVNKKTMSVQFKPGYAPFEQYNRNGNQGPWTDVYGLCATMYKCITGVTPVDCLERCMNDTIKKPSELGAKISPELESVLMYGLAVAPENRCQSMAELIKLVEKALGHENVVIEKNKVDISKPEEVDEYKTIAADNVYKTTGADQIDDVEKKNPVADVGDFNNSAESLKKSEVESIKNGETKKKSPVIAIVVAVVVLLIGGVAGFIILNGTGDDDNSADSTVVATDVDAESETYDVMNSYNVIKYYDESYVGSIVEFSDGEVVYDEELKGWYLNFYGSYYRIAESSVNMVRAYSGRVVEGKAKIVMDGYYDEESEAYYEEMALDIIVVNCID